MGFIESFRSWFFGDYPADRVGLVGTPCRPLGGGDLTTPDPKNLARPASPVDLYQGGELVRVIGEERVRRWFNGGLL